MTLEQVCIEVNMTTQVVILWREREFLNDRSVLEEKSPYFKALFKYWDGEKITIPDEIAFDEIRKIFLGYSPTASMEVLEAAIFFQLDYSICKRIVEGIDVEDMEPSELEQCEERLKELFTGGQLAELLEQVKPIEWSCNRPLKYKFHPSKYRRKQCPFC